MKTGNKNHVFALLCSLILSVVALFLASVACFLYLCSPINATEQAYEERFTIPSGTTVHEVAGRLKQGGFIRSEKLFYLVARYPFLVGRKQAFVLKSGVYEIKSSYSVAELLDLFQSAQQAYIRLVFPEGLTISKIAAMLEEHTVCTAADFSKAAHSKKLLEAYAIPSSSLEGYFFPDTYFFTPAMEAEAVCRIMLDNFFTQLSYVPSLQNASPEKIHKTLILASIVEREYRVENEAPLIASVFSNRIAAGIGLYSCATIEYIITEIQGKPHPDVITYADLQIDSPYNTYKWAGLTPGPISNPGLVALQAAANPPTTDYYYFRLTDSTAGTHTFSKSFTAHTGAAVYQTKKAASR